MQLPFETHNKSSSHWPAVQEPASPLLRGE